MAIPTRFIEREEFEELLELEEGDTIATYKLTAVPFHPPHPDGDDGHEEPVEQSIRVMLLPVLEPRLYRDPQGVTFVVFPSFETIDYAAAQDMHPVKDAWCYRFVPYHWGPKSPLVHAAYLFKEEVVPPFVLGDTDTH